MTDLAAQPSSITETQEVSPYNPPHKSYKEYHIQFYAVRVRHRLNNPIVECRATYKYIAFNDMIWLHDVSTRSYAAMFGIYKIARLIPYRLENAFSTNQTTYAKGTYEIKLVTEPLRFYKDMLANELPDSDFIRLDSVMLTEIFSKDESSLQTRKEDVDIYTAVSLLLQTLDDHDRALRNRDFETIVSTGNTIISYAKDIQLFYDIYMSLIRKQLITFSKQHRRSPTYD